MGAPPAGSILGERYVLSAKLAEAPGHVELRALDRELEVEVALWWLRPQLFPGAARQDAALGTGVELRQLHDPALRKCFGVGRGTGGMWAIWQLATSAGPVPMVGEAVSIGELRRWLATVGQGLSVLHAQGFVHGRLSPADVVSVGGALKLGGGGLWRAADPRAAAEAWAAFQHHLAPEVRHGEPASEAADVWSMAAIALEMIAGTSSAEPDMPRMAARRHPDLTAVLVGAMNPDPGRRPSIVELALATHNAGEAPYRDAMAPRGKQAQHRGDAATLVGHATSAAPTAPRTTASRAAAPTRPPPTPPRPGAFAPQPETFALPTPTAAPRAPRPTPPVVVPVRQPGSGPVAAPPPSFQPPPPAMPTPARIAIAGAIDRARTAPPGEYVLAAVSLKPKAEVPAPPVLPAKPTGGTPVLPKAKMRGMVEAQGGRSFSVAPGQLGYLAPPKAVTDAQNQRQRRWWWLVILLLVLAIGGGVTLGLLL